MTLRVVILLWLALGSVAAVRAQSSSGPAAAPLGYEGVFSWPLREGLHLLGGKDSVYLIRPARYRFYQRLHRHLSDTAGAAAADALLRSYERTLLDARHAYDTLLLRYHTADRLATRTLSGTQATLLHLRHTLGQTKTSLHRTTQQLEEARQQQRSARRRAFLRGLAYGSGAGAGLLTLLRLAVR